MRLGVDIGGTFTDFVQVGDDGRVTLHKRLTTPADPAQALLAGVEALALPVTARVVHGSTIATNALLERRGARTALITTAGFQDLIEIGRQNRPDLYALVPMKPAPLVPRQWRYELHERVSATGEILIPLDPAEIDALIPTLIAENIEAVAVCFLFSFLRPEHEQLVKERLEIRDWRLTSESPISNLLISLSSDLLPEYREYERASTTLINAYVQPLMARYLTRLEAELQPRPLHIMQSNGGCISAHTARAQAARTALSGPAGGVVGAFEIAKQSPMLQFSNPPISENWRIGELNLITFDMGGTSTDVCLCPGQIPFTSEGELGGLPLRLPIIDIHTVGAGGGSLAQVDAGGALTVGPQSAGAEPGPACYGRGGLTPTVTDANVMLNRLPPAHFLGGQMALNVDAARTAFERLAATLQSPIAHLQSLAWGVLQVANATMERALRKISVERGYDPADFTLVAFGGAGPLHACELAAQLGVRQVLVPRWPGVLSALGMVLADLIKDYAYTHVANAEALTSSELATRFAPLEAQARREMRGDGVSEPTLERSLDLRYVGQSFEINVPFSQSLNLPISNLFHPLHAQRFGHAHPAQAVECVTLRLRAVGATPRPRFAPLAVGGVDPRAAQVDEGAVWFAAGWQTTPIFAREKLLAHNELRGPALVVQLDTTTVIPPGWVGVVDEAGNVRISP